MIKFLNNGSVRVGNRAILYRPQGEINQNTAGEYFGITIESTDLLLSCPPLYGLEDKCFDSADG